MLPRVTCFIRSWAPVIAGCAYALLVAGWLLGGWHGTDAAAQVSWYPLPPQIGVALLVGWLLRDPQLPRLRRIAWLFVLAAIGCDAVATAGFAYVEASTHEVYGTWADVLYLLYYPFMALACATFFVAAGGSWRRPRVWLDAATLASALAAALWPFLFSPLFTATQRHDLSLLTTIGYGAGNVLIMTVGALLFMQIMHWRSERATLMVLVATLIGFLTDLWWVTEEVRGRYALGALYDVGYCLLYTFLAAGAIFARRRDTDEMQTRAAAGNAYGFLPVLAVLMAIALLFVDRAGTHDSGSMLLAAMVVVAAALVVVRQLGVRHDLQRLHTALAVREAESRMTELVRRSSDLIAVAGRDRTLGYVSPAADPVLGTAPSALLGTPAARMLGADHEAKLGAFLDYLAQEHGRSAEMEAELTTPAGERRMVQVIGSNQLDTPAINGTALTVRDVTERRRLEQELRSLAFFDPLTLLANRSLFGDRVQHAVGRIRDGCRPAVLFIDLDNFKAINDGLGHEAGDQLLRSSAQRIVQGTRESDTVARLGGDEFAILMDDAGSVAAMQTVARGILASLAAPTLLEGRSLNISASIGMCLAGPGTTAESLLRHADTAMYRAKALGKGQAVVFETKMLETVRRRLQIEHEMTRALERGEFGIHYQPMVDMQTGHLLGVEALMRWRHGRLGVMPPVEFIPIAEETGLIVPMTRWILGQACSDLSRARRTVHRGDGLRISVNVSGECLKHDAIVADVERALTDSGLDASALVLEVTESLLLQGTREIGDRMAAIKRLGVRMALDDFGTGYSSLGYLHRFPVDILKMDRSFVQQLGGAAGEQHDKASAFAKAILSLADALGLDTVAEGVETDAQKNALLRLGCRVGQGYLFGHPLPLDELMASEVAERRELLITSIDGPIDFTASGRFRTARQPDAVDPGSVQRKVS